MLKQFFKKVFGKRTFFKNSTYYTTRLGFCIQKTPFSSHDYWENRYKSGHTSGEGSYGRLANFKATIINSFIAEHNIADVIEFGVGDGNQLSLLSIKNYIGFDVSAHIIQALKEKFCNDNTKSFLNTNEYSNQKAELTLSLDVLYHLIEKNIFELYMHQLFKASTHYIIIYSTNFDQPTQALHVKHRNFTNWINQHYPNWECINFIKNQFSPTEDEEQNTSAADFYIFQKV